MEIAAELVTRSEAETREVARRLAPFLEAGDLVLLAGDLGAGKTAFVRGLCDALEVPPEDGVASPTFALVHVYGGGRVPIAHVDLYRLGGEDDLEADEFESIGARDLFTGERLVLVEWPEHAPGLDARADLRIDLEDRGAETRGLRISARDPERAAALGPRLGSSPSEPA